MIISDNGQTETSYKGQKDCYDCQKQMAKDKKKMVLYLPAKNSENLDFATPDR